MKTYRYEPWKGQNDLLFAILLYIVPTLILIFIFQLLPIFRAVQYSFYRYNLISGSKTFLGLKNYVAAFQDERFIHSLKVTFTYFGSYILGSHILVLPALRFAYFGFYLFWIYIFWVLTLLGFTYFGV